MAHEHDRFLNQRDGYLHFGCTNPFCGHGNPALPQHYKVPLDSQDVTMKLNTHLCGKLEIVVTPKDPKYGPAILISDDNVESCAAAFNDLIFPAI